MKFCIFNEVYDTKSLSDYGMKVQMQKRLDAWLGKGNTTVDVQLPSEREMVLTLHRDYGSWYKDPKLYSSCNDSISAYDKQIFLTEDYQTGTQANWSNHEGRYIINYSIKDFCNELKTMAKANHASRIKSVEIDNYLDHVILRILLL